MRASYLVLRKIRKEERNPEFRGDKFRLKFLRYEKIIALLIIINVIIEACNNYYYFVMMDRYLSEKYKEEYIEWKL